MTPVLGFRPVSAFRKPPFGAWKSVSRCTRIDLEGPLEGKSRTQ